MSQELELYLLPRRRGRFMLYSRALLEEREAIPESSVPDATLRERAKALLEKLEARLPASEKVLKEAPDVTTVRIHHPAGLDEDRARAIYDELLEQQIRTHKKWMIVNGALLPFSALLTLIPGPNVVLAYLAWRTIGHYKGRGLGRSMTELQVTFVADEPLEYLRRTVRPLFTFRRARKIRYVSRILGLPGIERVYLKRVSP